MVTQYIGADVDCKMTELAIESRGKIVRRVPGIPGIPEVTAS